MLWIGNKRVARIWIGSKPVQALWLGAKKIWEAVRSCFGSGCWRDDRPWVDDEIWKD